MIKTATVPLRGVRTNALVVPINFVGIDLTDAVVTAVVLQDWDNDPADPEIALTETPNGNGSGVVVGTITTTSGVTTSPVTLTIGAADMAAIPDAAEVGGNVTWVWYLMIQTDSGDVNTKQRYIEGDFIIGGAMSNGTGSVTATIADEEVNVSIDGITLLSPLVTRAQDAADDAEAFSESAAASSASAATSLAAFEDAAADAAPEIFLTKAGATAGLSGVTEGAFLQVVIDESMESHRTLYRKVSGVLTFVKDLDLGKDWFLEDFGATCYATRLEASVGDDASDAIDAFLAAWYAAEGATLKLNGWYRATRSFLLPNSNTTTTIGVQPPLSIIGTGSVKTYARPVGGSGIIWTDDGAAPSDVLDPVAKFDTRGRGQLFLENFIMASLESSGNTKPFIHTTFTTVVTGKAFAIDGAVYGASAAEDGFVLGGTTDHEVDPGFDRRSSDCGFQGYGTIIDGVYFNGTKRAALLRRYANAIRISNNTVWNTCANPTGAAFEVDGQAGGYATGTVFLGNLVEATRFKYCIALYRTARAVLIGNDCYDPDTPTLGGVYVDTSCANILVFASLAPGLHPYLVDADRRAMILGNETPNIDVLQRLRAGLPDYANEFLDTRFVRPQALVVQSEGSLTNGYMMQFKRGALDTDPGAEVFSFLQSGEIRINAGASSATSQSGNISNGLTNGAGWSANGRTWSVANGSGNMLIYSGSGGSTCTHRHFANIFQTHTSADVAKIDSARGGVGAEGIAFGSAFDVELYRSAAGTLKTNATILPATDNTQNLGSGSLRMATIYAGTGTINSSDATLKDVRGALSEAEIAWARAIRFNVYRFKDAIAEKGDAARLHVGVIAQEVHAAGIACGIADPFAYGFLCRDLLTTSEERTRHVRRPKREIVMVPVREVEIVDGLPVEIEREEAQERIVCNDVQVRDAAGELLWFDDEKTKPRMFAVPVMEDAEESYTEIVPVIGEDGEPVQRWSVRYEELLAFVFAGVIASGNSSCRT